jgi:hypothetical protein
MQLKYDSPGASWAAIQGNEAVEMYKKPLDGKQAVGKADSPAMGRSKTARRHAQLILLRKGSLCTILIASDSLPDIS